MALFKIEKGLAANLKTNRPEAVEGYCYFTKDDGKFYIDIATGAAVTPAENGGALAGSTRMPINSYLSDWATRALADQDGNEFTSTYGKELKISDTYTLKLITPNGSESEVTLPKDVESAKQFTTNKTIKLTGAVTGSKSAKAGWTIATTLSDNIVGTANLIDDAVTNDKIANPTISINGKSIELGGSASLADLGLGSALRFAGISETAITDGSSTTSVTLTNGKIISVSIGDVIINKHNNQEYLWTGEFWELLGDEIAYDLAGTAQGLIDKIKFNPVTDQVLGANTTFTTSPSAISFADHTKKDVVGPNATFTVTNPTISVTPSKTNIKATANGTAVTLNTDVAITAIGKPTTAEFITSYPGASSKMITTTIKGVAGTEVVSKISENKKVTASKINKVGTQAKLEFEYTENDETLKIQWTSNELIEKEDIDATYTSYNNTTVATAADNATTVATGSLSSSGTGSSVMTGLGTATKSSAITAIGTLTTKSFATTVKSVTQPTIALATGATAGTGVISLVSGISSANATGGAVAFNSKDLVSVITGIGAATATAQTITVGTNDKVTALTGASTLTKT